MENFFDILFGFGSKKLEHGGPAGEPVGGIWVSVNDEPAIALEEFHKANTAEGVDSLTPEDFEEIKKLRVGEGLHYGQSSYVERVMPPNLKPTGKEGEVAEQLDKVSQNNYAGLTPEQVWDTGWDIDQKTHFLEDHRIEIPELNRHGEFSKEIIRLNKLTYSELPVSVKDAIGIHVSEGQYGFGGNIKHAAQKIKAGAKSVFTGISDKELAQMEKEASSYKGGGPVKALKVEKGEHADFYHVRFKTPGQFKTFRTPPWAEKVASSVHKGSKAVMGKKEGKWHMQQILVPDTVAKGKVKKIAADIACKLSYECRKKNKK